MDSVTRPTGTAITVTRAIMAITHAAITAITGVLHTTGRITTLAGRTTTAATEFTATTSIIVITATNSVIRRIAAELAWKRFQASFFSYA